MERFSRFELEFVIEPQVRQSCGPIFFTRSLEQALGNVVSNGSFGLIDTGKKKLLVTCYHVWKGFKRDSEENPGLKMCVCLDRENPVFFNPDDYVGADETIDLITFDMTPYLSACGGLKFFNLKENPAPVVNKDDRIMFIGFPGFLRKVLGNSLTFGRSPFATVVSGIDGFQIQSDIQKLNLKPEFIKGISGCPCFQIRKDKPIRIIGFATSHFGHHLFFSHAGRIDENGKIIR